MYSALTVKIGPGTRESLREIAAFEGIPPEQIVEQAITTWSYLRGRDERHRAVQGVMGIVVERLRPARPEAA